MSRHIHRYKGLIINIEPFSLDMIGFFAKTRLISYTVSVLWSNLGTKRHLTTRATRPEPEAAMAEAPLNPFRGRQNVSSRTFTFSLFYILSYL